LAPKTDSAVGAEFPDAGVAAALLVEAGADEFEEVLGAVEVGAGELATPLPVVGIATPIFLASAAALPSNKARKSPAPAVGFEVLAGGADEPAPESELIEVR
jgi:hypothetical protein